MSEEANEGRRGWLWGCLALLALLVFYVLSIGPAALVVTKTGVGVWPFKAVYMPLILLCEDTRLEKPLHAYVEVWRK